MVSQTLVSIEEYLRTSYRPDCDFIDGEVRERNVGKRRHSFTQGRIYSWFDSRRQLLNLEPFPELRMRVAPGRVRIPDVVVCEIPIPDEEVFTSPPYLCVEVLSPEDTMSSMQERIDDYLAFGVANIWVVDPWKYRGWTVDADGWAAESLMMRTRDGIVEMPLDGVFLP
jgi:hypothetical protein